MVLADRGEEQIQLADHVAMHRPARELGAQVGQVAFSTGRSTWSRRVAFTDGEAGKSAKRVTAFIATHGNDAVIICARITRNVIDALMSCKAD